MNILNDNCFHEDNDHRYHPVSMAKSKLLASYNYSKSGEIILRDECAELIKQISKYLF